MSVDPIYMATVVISAFASGTFVGYVTGYITAHRRHR